MAIGQLFESHVLVDRLRGLKNFSDSYGSLERRMKLYPAPESRTLSNRSVDLNDNPIFALNR